MKKTLIICFGLLLVACKNNNSKSIEKVEDVGKKVFEIVKGLDKNSLQDYKKSIITYQDFKELANNPNAPLGDYYRADLQSLTQKEYNETMNKDFNSLKETGVELGINWGKISFVKFRHDIQKAIDNEDCKILLGELYLKNNDGKIYFVKSASFFDGEGYRLIKVAEIQPDRTP